MPKTLGHATAVGAPPLTGEAAMMERVDAILRRLCVGSDGLRYDTTFQDACRWAIDTKGKRLRLRLFVQAARMGECADPDRLAAGATAVELLHLASLVHDDVIDASDTRRGKPSVRSRFGDQAALLSGCWLAARAVQLVAACGDVPARMLADTARRMCDGQILELHDLGRIDRSVARYLRSIEGKTGSLFALSSALAAQLSGAPADEVEALERYGRNLGIAFQIVDDTLDVGGDPVAIGKDVGTDLRRGLYTLPVLYALDADPALRSAFGADGPHAKDPSALLRDVARAGGIETALVTACEHLDNARHAIRHLAATDELEGLTDALIDYGRSGLASGMAHAARENRLETADVAAVDERSRLDDGVGGIGLAPVAGLPDALRDDVAAVLDEVAGVLYTDFPPLRETLETGAGSPAAGICAATVLGLIAESEGAFRERGVSAARALELVALLPRLTRDMTRAATHTPPDPSTNALRVLAVDLVQSRALVAAAEAGASFTRMLAQTVAAWSEAQMLQSDHVGDRRTQVSAGIETARHHLGDFVELAARATVQLSHLPPDDTEGYARFGHELGVATQLASDCVELLSPDRGMLFGGGEDAARAPASASNGGVASLPLTRISAPVADVVSHGRRSVEALEQTTRSDTRSLEELAQVPVRLLHDAFSAP
jgi:geranylgeranyl pyrophosphate synthase